jgi:hypothetical protein
MKVACRELVPDFVKPLLNSQPGKEAYANVACCMLHDVLLATTQLGSKG